MDYRTLKIFLTRNWLTVAFIGGFVTDLLLLNRVDDILDNVILLTYVTLATGSLILFYAGVAERLGTQLSQLTVKYGPILMQYAFGGLLSGMLIFYGRSGDWLTSAPFLILILIVIVGNEVLEKRSDTLVYRLALYFIGLFSYVVLVLPVILGKMGDGVFILSGLLALIITSGVIKILFRFVPNFLQQNIRRIIILISILYVSMTGLYFFNLIPPIPLSLTQLDIVESVYRDAQGVYRVSDERQPWYRRLPLVRDRIVPDGSSIACFARVYAPTRLETKIFHRWEYKNEQGDWEEAFRFGYDITGENKGGYGGYTVLNPVTDGVWRCGVENERGQVLGRTTIRVRSDIEGKETVTRLE